MNRDRVFAAERVRVPTLFVPLLLCFGVLASGGQRSDPRRERHAIAASDCRGLPDGSPCDDGNACTAGETCQSGACVFPVTFSEASGSPVGVETGPVSVAIGDFNLDGHLDFATANFGSGSVTISLGNGSGGFAQAANSPVAVRGFPIFIVEGDFNLDGKPDLAAASQGTDNVTILLGDGSGGFAPGSPVGVGSFPLSIAAGDFNLDGKQDLAVVNNASSNVSILLGNGSGGFDEAVGSPVGAGRGPTSVAVDDFNVDGKLDLAVANFDDHNVTILLGDGVGGFAEAAGSPVGVGDGPISLAVGDFDLDGKADLAAANLSSDNVTILLGNGLGGFTEASGSPVHVESDPYSVAVGDLDLDGKPDLIVASSSDPPPGHVTMLMGNGSGGFTAAAGSPSSVGSLPIFVGVADFNVDHKPDMVVANNLSKNVTVLLNTSGVVACPASDGCSVGVCVPATGACATIAAPDGATCSDRNPCTTNDRCHAGACGGAAVTCTVDPCHVAGTCDSATGCPSVPEGTDCSDRNACTQTDRCQNGSCVGSDPVACPQPDQCHVLGTCDPATGTCSNPNGPDDRACDDGNACTNADMCRSGVCVTPVAFTEAEGLPSGSLSFSFSVAVSDFNLDGNDDLAVAIRIGDFSYHGNVTILLGNGAGGFTAGPGPPTRIPDGPYVVAAGDFDLDGKPDLAVVVPVGKEVTILRGDGTGRFTEAAGSPIRFANEPLFVAVGDFNLDGRPDLAVTISSSTPTGTVRILLGNGSGGFTEATGSPVDVGDTPTRIAISDFNLDGKPDLAVVNAGSSSLSILLGDGSGGFSDAAGSPVGMRPSPRSIVAGDFDLDGRPDLAVTTENYYSTDRTVTVLLGDGSGGFAEAAGSPVGVGTNSSSIVGGDFNLDGKPDLAVAILGSTDGTPMSATILLGNGSGRFTEAAGSPVHMAGAPEYFAVGDFNRDGRPDIAAAGFFDGHTGATLLNSWSVGVCPGTDACQVGLCDPATGACTTASAPIGASCSDGNACTTNDGCREGTCRGATVTCTAIDPCHVPGSCDPAIGCSNPNAQDGTPCSDGNACTQSDVCENGACAGSDPVSCPPPDPCHVSTCNAETGICSSPSEPDGTPCSDGNACTENDTCSAGSCVSGSPLSCDDGDPCTIDSCDQASGCRHTPDPSCNHPPDCAGARPSAGELWPPDHRMVPIRIEGVVDPNGDPVPVRVTGITQDEAVGTGHGATCPDGAGIGTDEAVLRAERDAKGDGRVYTVSFTARDSNGIECTGAVRVCVPHDQAHPTCGDDGPRANSVGPCSASAK